MLNFLHEMSDNFLKKNVIVTGGNAGSGLAISCALLELNYNVIRVDKKFDKKIGSKDIIFNLEKYKQIDSLLKKIKRQFHRVDVLINNAGVTYPSKQAWNDFDIYHKTLSVNLHAPFYLISKITHMMPINSSIIQITSLGSKLGFKNNPSYQISKAALAQITKCGAVDFKKKKIRFNSICPGYIKTNMTKKSYNSKKRNKEIIDRIISNRFGETEDIVNAVIFLISPHSSYINGATLDIDGGYQVYGI